MSTPPILIAIFNRPNHTAQVFDAIRKVRPARLFVHADGPRHGVNSDVGLCEAARNEIHVDWDCDVQWQVSATNLGCKIGMYQAVSWFFDQVEAGVVLEDDCVPDPSFFEFCGELLDRYSEDRRIFGISGNNFLSQPNLAASYYFLKTTHIWGWASWRRSWKLLDLAATEWPKLEKSGKMEAFLKDSHARAFWSHILDDLHSGQGNTWSGAIIYTMLKHDMLGIHPRCNLVSNHGFGTTGVHVTPEDHKLARVPTSPMGFPLVHPGFVRLSVDFDQYVRDIWELEPSGKGMTAEKGAVFDGPSMGDWIRRQALSQGTPADLLDGATAITAAPDEAEAAMAQPSLLKTSEVEPSMGDMLRQQMQQMQQVAQPVAASPLQQPTELAAPVPDLAAILTLEDEVFVPAAYRGILLRDPDAAGLNYYKARLQAGISRTQILGQLSASGETETARQLYAKLRFPYWALRARNSPLIGWVAELACMFGKFHLREILAGDEISFITRAYTSVLGRQPDSKGVSHYESLLDKGCSKLDILIDLKLSREGKQAGSRVAGLTALAGFVRMRRMPVLRHILDILELPWSAAESLRSIRATQLAVQRLNARQRSDLESIKSLINGEHQTIVTLSERFDSYAAQAVELSSRLDGLSSQLHGAQKAITEQQLVQYEELSASLPRLAEDVKVPLMAKFALADRMQHELRRQIDRHVLALNALMSRECAQLGWSIPKALEESKAIILDRLSATDRAFETLGFRMQEQTRDAAARIANETVAVGQQVRTMGCELAGTLQRAEGNLSTRLDRAAAEARAANDALRSRLVKETVDVAERIAIETAAVSQQVKATEAELAGAVHRAEVSLATRLDFAVAETQAAQNVLVGRFVEKAVDAATRITNETAAIGLQVQARVDSLAALVMRTEAEISAQFEHATAEALAGQEALVRRLEEESAMAAKQYAKESASIGEKLQTIAAEGLAANDAIGQRLLNEVVETVSSINRASSEIVHHVQAKADALATALNRIEAGLSDQLRAAVFPLQGILPQTIESARAAVDRLLPQLGRIELYSMTAARRVAVPCGAESVLVRTVVGYLLCSDRDHALIATLVETGDLEPGTRQLIQRLLGPGDIFVDVGANIGMHTLAAARAMSGQGRIFAIEPHPQTAKMLAQSAWMNGFAPMVHVHPVAAAASSGERRLHIGATSGHHSLFPLDAQDAMDAPAIKVRATTIDQIFPKENTATLIKIDAEGAELEVLKGAAGVLKRSPDIGIIAEFGGSHLRRTGTNTATWLSEFTQHGFQFRAIQGDTGALREISVEELNATGSVNLLFARPQSPLWHKAGLTS